MKNRLSELIRTSDILCDSCGENAPSYCAEAIADYLIENGVIVPPCKVGDNVDFNKAKTRVDDLGRIHIPKEMRAKVGIAEGDILQLTATDNLIVIEKYDPEEETDDE